MPLEKVYVVGENKVSVTVSAEWDTFGEGHWEFLARVRVNADGRDYDSIRWSNVTAGDLQDGFKFLDGPQWPNTTPPNVLIGKLDNNQLRQIVAEISDYARKSYPMVDADEVYYGH